MVSSNLKGIDFTNCDIEGIGVNINDVNGAMKTFGGYCNVKNILIEDFPLEATPLGGNEEAAANPLRPRV